MRRILLLVLPLIACLLIPVSASADHGPAPGSANVNTAVGPAAAGGRSYHAAKQDYTFFGSAGAASLITPGFNSNTAAQLTTTGDGFGGLATWSAVDVAIPRGLKLGHIRWLSTEYRFTLGSCWEGSPRFELWIPDSSSPTGHDKVFLYIGPLPTYQGCAVDKWTNTGNLATATGYVDDSQLPGGTSMDTWAHAQAVYGSDPISAVYVDLDGGWYSNQTVQFDDTRVNSTTVTYETK